MARSVPLLSMAILLACSAPPTQGYSVLLDGLNEPRGLWLWEDGTLCVAVADLTTPIDLAFDRQERLYVLEFTFASVEGHPYRDWTGRLLRFEPTSAGWESGQVLLEGLPHPTAVLAESDGTIYITVHGAYSEAGQGRVLSFAAAEFDSGNAPAIQYAEP